MAFLTAYSRVVDFDRDVAAWGVAVRGVAVGPIRHAHSTK